MTSFVYAYFKKAVKRKVVIQNKMCFSEFTREHTFFMVNLLITSLIWAFSFGLIKGGLEGIPSPAITVIRLGIAFIVFLPFLKPAKLPIRTVADLLFTGAVQYGLMYLFYIEAFRHLKAHEIALFTVFTPFFVSLIHDIFEKKINLVAFCSCLLAVTGGLIIQYNQPTSTNLQAGFLLMQISNICFAFGQVRYRRIMAELKVFKSDLQIFGLLYFGATITAMLAACTTDWSAIVFTHKQLLILAYLGTIAAGLGFFLWNAGARQVSPGTLAVFNNLKIPLGIIVSIVFFGESVNWRSLLTGGSLMLLALFLNERFNPCHASGSKLELPTTPKAS